VIDIALLHTKEPFWRQLRREGIRAARCTVERLMPHHGVARQEPRLGVEDHNPARSNNSIEVNGSPDFWSRIGFLNAIERRHGLSLW
jgi:hypothetical protein